MLVDDESNTEQYRQAVQAYCQQVVLAPTPFEAGRQAEASTRLGSGQD